ncbi:unnamed protein product [Heterotrigona itama]|uniref:Pre-C2HC domain-containing protein n=1 Tax=Heterotrigona itama TaxID=395501 RepID=A0A6V7H5F1_9HYME|nr:unnamed protein product [Heterotrigona itama]
MDIINPTIQTTNRFSLFTEQDNSIQNPSRVTPLHTYKAIYVHGKINHAKLLDVLKEKYNNAFQAKFISNKLKIIFANDFAEFKTTFQKEYQEYHTYTVSEEKTITVALKGLIKLPEARICNNIKNQGLNSIQCTEIPIQAKHPIYRKSTMSDILKTIKIYWEKFESHKSYTMLTSANCNKKAVCVKCAGPHDFRICTKLETPPICANCKGNQQTFQNVLLS